MIDKKILDKRYKDKTKIIRQNFYLAVGDKCFFCGCKDCLSCHRKDIKNHIPIANLSMRQIEKEKKSNYVRLCFKCHYGVHWCNNHLKMSWEDIILKFKIRDRGI